MKLLSFVLDGRETWGAVVGDGVVDLGRRIPACPTLADYIASGRYLKAAEDVRAVIRDMPGDRIIVETDCPYLAPIPHRGRRNEPAYVGHVLDKLAEIRGWSAEEADQRTTEAFFGLFDRIPRSA